MVGEELIESCIEGGALCSGAEGVVDSVLDGVARESQRRHAAADRIVVLGMPWRGKTALRVVRSAFVRHNTRHTAWYVRESRTRAAAVYLQPPENPRPATARIRRARGIAPAPQAKQVIHLPPSPLLINEINTLKTK